LEDISLKKKHIWILALIGIASFVSEFGFLASTDHGHWWNHVPGFYALWGFGGCVVIIAVSKWLGKRFVQQKEDYYDSK